MDMIIFIKSMYCLFSEKEKTSPDKYSGQDFCSRKSQECNY